MTKSMLALEFEWCKSNAGVYYFIDKGTRELVIAIVYVIILEKLKSFLEYT